MKKGQITIFIIAGMVILAIFILMLTIVIPAYAPSRTESSVKDFASSCFSLAETCSLAVLGDTGGNLEANPELKTLDEINRLSQGYFNEESANCEDNFTAVKDASVKKDSISSDFFFNMKDTIVKSKQKLIVKQGESEKTIADFVTKLPVRFDSCHTLASAIKQHDLKLINSSYINANLLEDEFIDGNVYEGKANVIVLTDRESKLKDEFYKFSFIK